MKILSEIKILKMSHLKKYEYFKINSIQLSTKLSGVLLFLAADEAIQIQEGVVYDTGMF